jgi:SAM-dependent methyltransferase
LSQELYGEIIPLVEFRKNKNYVGIGLSDTEIYARPLSLIFSYVNTYYHKDPKLDITSVPSKFINSADFVIASDVFEHIPPPIEKAFCNLYNVVKNGGVVIFSVPYINHGTTIEHFPEIFDYHITTEGGKKLLINKTRDGKIQRYENLRFHGGAGATLEMRIFSKPSLIKHIESAGFTDITVYDMSTPEFGILANEEGSSFVMSMRKTVPENTEKIGNSRITS